MDKIRAISRINSLPVILIGVLFLAALCLYQLTGMQADDIVYRHEFVGTQVFDDSFSYCKGELITTVRQVMDSIEKHNRLWTNGRLGSAIIFAANLWPLWITETINALALALMFFLILRMGLGRRWVHRPLACMILTLAIWWVLPWNEYMLVTAFAINYTWATCLCLWFLWLLMSRRGRVLPLCLLAFVSSLMHEGISLTMDVLLFCLCMEKLIKRGWNTRFMLPAIIFAAGSMLVLLSPSVLMRSGHGENINVTLWLRGVAQLFCLKFYILTLLVIFLPFLRKRIGGRRFKRFMIFAGPVIIAGIFSAMEIFISSNYALRSGWMGYVLCFIVWGRIMRYYSLPRVAKIKSALAWTLLVIMSLWLCALIGWQYKIRGEIDSIKKENLSTGNTLIYKDITNPFSLPWWTLNIPVTYYDSNYFLSFHLASQRIEGWDTVNTVDTKLQLITVLPRDEKFRHRNSYPVIAGPAEIRKINDASFYSVKRSHWVVLMTWGEPGDKGIQSKPLPWYELRKKLIPYRPGYRHMQTLVTKPMLVTESMRRAGFVPEDVDTVYFYELEYFSMPRNLRGNPVIRIDSL